jgi:hypothetical protein
MGEVMVKLVFVLCLFLAQSVYAQDDITPPDEEPTIIIFAVVSDGDDGDWWCDEDEGCSDPNGCPVEILVYDPVDPTVLDAALLILLFERPWLEETFLAMCPADPLPRCNMCYFEGEGVAGDDWSGPVTYIPGDEGPLEEAIMLLLERNPGVLLEVPALCPCSL